MDTKIINVTPAEFARIAADPDSYPTADGGLTFGGDAAYFTEDDVTAVLDSKRAAYAATIAEMDAIDRDDLTAAITTAIRGVLGAHYSAVRADVEPRTSRLSDAVCDALDEQANMLRFRLGVK